MLNIDTLAANSQGSSHLILTTSSRRQVLLLFLFTLEEIEAWTAEVICPWFLPAAITSICLVHGTREARPPPTYPECSTIQTGLFHTFSCLKGNLTHQSGTGDIKKYIKKKFGCLSKKQGFLNM